MLSALPVPLARLDDRRLKLAAALLAVYAIWGTTFLAIAIALRGLPPFLLGGLRYMAAGLVMAVVATALGHARPSRREVGSALVLGLFFVAIGNGALTWAEQYVATGPAALLGAVGPLFLLMAEACLPGGDRPTKRGVAGVLLGFSGVALLVGPGGGFAAPGAFAGEVALVVSAALCTLGLLLAKRVSQPASWAWSSALMMGSGGVVMTLVGLGTGELARTDWAAVPTAAWLGFAYLVVFGSCLAFSAFSFLTKEARPQLVATINYVIPVLATLLGAVVLAEPITLTTLASAAMIVGAVALVAVGGRRAQPD